MPFSYTTRRGKTYYLHTGPKRGGGTQHYVSTDPKGPLAETIPEGFEIYETPNGQVYLRKIKPARIQPDELAVVEGELQKRQSHKHRYLGEISDGKIIIYEGDTRIDALREINVRFSAPALEEYAAHNADFVPVMRFVLQDDPQRLFEPQRFCFRGSVEDWISIGRPDQLKRLAATFLKHLGKDSFYELY
jgi:hypothetical protein